MNLIQITVFFLYITSFYGLGNLIYQKGRYWEKFLTGMFFHGIYLFIILHFSIVNSITLFLPFITITGFFYKFIYKQKPEFLSDKKIFIFFIIIFIIPILTALIPPFKYFDELYYQLTIPNQWILNKGIYLFRYEWTTFFPAFGTLLYMPIIKFAGITSPQLLTVFSLLLISTILFSVIKENDPGKEYLTVLIFTLTPFIYILSSFAYNGYIEMLFLFGGAVELFNYTKTKENDKLLLAALFIGAGGSTKYQGILLAAFIYFLAIILIKDRKKIFFSGVLALIIISPWYIRNFIATGNPIWPFLNKFFGVEQTIKTDILASSLTLTKTNRLFFILSKGFLWNFIKPYRGIQSIAGPLYIALIPWTLYEIKEKKILISLLIIIISTPIIYITDGNPRYFFILFTLGAYLSVLGYYIWRKKFKIVKIIIIIVILLQILISSKNIFYFFSYITSDSKSSFLSKQENSYELSEFTKLIPENERVLTVNIKKVLYLNRLSLIIFEKKIDDLIEKTDRISDDYKINWIVSKKDFYPECKWQKIKETRHYILWKK